MRYLFLLLFSFVCTCCFSQQMEEFNGSFPSWANVKLRFGARGNGKDNDTKAIQNAIDGLGATSSNGSTGPAYTVLYLPAGTYCISATLLLRGKIGITIVGEDPANTIIKWIGADAATMFWANGSAYYKISRLTWDANNHKEIEAIGIHWRDRWNDGKSQSYASLNIEISDNVFTGHCKFGISGGTGSGDGTNNNDSEIAIKRCLFQNCTGAGIITTGYNALDYWVWDCRFISCNIGINSRYGNFHAYRSYFKSSVQCDVANTNGFYKSMRDCFSEDSQGFLVDSGAGYNPFKRVYQANTVLRPKWIPVQFYYLGRMMFTDNIFDRSGDTTINSFANSSSTILSLNNTYRSKLPAKFFAPAASIKQINDSYSASITSSSASFLQRLDKTPANMKRPVFEVPANADAVAIQQIINNAAKLTGKNPVIHFALGTYKINRPLLIPANTDLQILGDGFLYASVLLPANDFPAGNPLVKISGPSAIVVRDLQIGNFSNNASANDAIQFVHSDQDGSRAFIDQLYAIGNKSISAEGMDYLYIQKDNSFFADNDFISGGPLVQTGKGTAGIYGFGGQFAGISLQNNAKAVYKDCWWEGARRVPVDLSGSGNLTIDCAMIAPVSSDSNTTISVKKFKGNISLLNMYILGGVDVQADNPDLKMFISNAHFYYVLNPLKFVIKKSAFQGLFSGITTQCFISGDKKCEQINMVADAANLVSNADTFIPGLMADDRNALPKKYEIKNSKSSNIFISRVAIGDMNNAIRFIK